MEVSIKRFEISLKQCLFKVSSSMNDIVTKTQKVIQKNEYKSIDKTPIYENLKAKRIWLRILQAQLNHCWSKRRHIIFSKCCTNEHKCKIVYKKNNNVSITSCYTIMNKINKK